MLPKREGFLCCPDCGRKILKITPATRAERLPAFCRQCRKYFTVDIVSGQCYLSQCPERSEKD